MLRRNIFSSSSRHLSLSHRLLTSPFSSTTIRMSSQSSNHPSSTSDSSPETTSSSRGALPAPGDNSDAITLDVSGAGTTVKLDSLGPLVVNQDGSMSRISNWEKMTDIEQQNTLRIIGKRNQQRLAALKQARGIDDSGK